MACGFHRKTAWKPLSTVPALGVSSTWFFPSCYLDNKAIIVRIVLQTKGPENHLAMLLHLFQLLFLFRLTPLTFPSHSLNMGTNDIWLANSNSQFSLSLLDTIYHPSNLIHSLPCSSPTQGRTHSFLTAPQPSHLSLCSLFLLQRNMLKTVASKDKRSLGS